jgi:hypothetical protein
VLLRRPYVLFFIDMETRRVRLAGVTAEPVADWVGQRARNLCFDLSEEGQQARFLIRNNDTKFTAAFDRVLAAAGMGVIRTPIRAPRANSVAERFVGTVRRECLDRLLILGRRHPEAVLAEYVGHYNGHRPHRFLDQRPLYHGAGVPIPVVDFSLTQVRRTEILDGLIHEYSRAARPIGSAEKRGWPRRGVLTRTRDVRSDGLVMPAEFADRSPWEWTRYSGLGI